MKLKNKYCSVNLEIDPAYSVGSADNRKYDLTFNPGEYGRGDYCKTLCFDIDCYSSRYTVALTGDGSCQAEDCAVLEEKILSVLLGWDIIQFDVKARQIIKRATVDVFGCCFGVFRVGDRYLIYGECEIAMLDSNFNKIWGFAGRDIFVSVTGKNPFVINKNSVSLYDFEDNYYEVDFNGKVIVDRPAGKN
ncbi:MAG: hypothetical protein IJL87_00900 [Clostridia bacterium]|nr:hypothetical protein [Clostridia bacterium]